MNISLSMNRHKFFAALLIAVSLMLAVSCSNAQQEPWNPEQLMPPARLASAIEHNKNVPLIINVGPAALIKGSVDIGPGSEKDNIQKLKTLLEKQDKNRSIVIYCGCCPFKNCPNVRPAFTLLNEMKFTDRKLLDLPRNIKADWVDHGYPVQDIK